MTLAAGLTVVAIAVVGTNPAFAEALVAGAAASAAAAVATRMAARRRREHTGG
jgi:hypothetical protein